MGYAGGLRRMWRLSGVFDNGACAIDLTARLQPRAENVGVARDLARRALAGWPHPDAIDTVVLLTSEVVTNAIVHGGPHEPSEELTVAVTHGDGWARVNVTDGNSRPPVIAEEWTDDLSGRGMLMVDELASAWGYRSLLSGKAVWFEVRD